MKLFYKALVDKLRSIEDLVATAKYASNRLSISMVLPQQKILVPGAYADANLSPLAGSSSSALKYSEVTVYLFARDMVTLADMQKALEDQFRHPDGREKKFDITDNSVYCIHSRWENVGKARWIEDLDSFEQPVNLFFEWAYK